MIHFVDYFSLNRILLRAIGLWPFQQSKFTEIHFILFSSILATAIVFQFTTFLTSRCTPFLILKISASTLVFSIAMLQYSSFRFNIKNVKDLITQLQHACDELEDENEIAILKKYNYTAKYYTITLALLDLFILFIGQCIGQFWPCILYIVLPINDTRPRHLDLEMEYFLDNEKYFYLILFHINAALFIGYSTIIAIGAMFITYLQYTCGMFSIASYRIEHAMEIDKLQDVNLINKNSISKKIIYAVHIHRQALNLSEHIISIFNKTYFCLTSFGVIILSLNLFQIIGYDNDLKTILLPFFSVVVTIIYMFCANYVGQNITDHNNHVFIVTYKIRWYAAPIHVQKLILFLLQRSSKEFYLTCGGLYVASFECFAMLIKASVSYFTVIYSTR
ncbi:hypothetical protein HN011_000962 [Eciton burchellii]|nr:hypothetical protein HN011_000962 [Eciton burchellii]